MIMNAIKGLSLCAGVMLAGLAAAAPNAQVLAGGSATTDTAMTDAWTVPGLDDYSQRNVAIAKGLDADAPLPGDHGQELYLRDPGDLCRPGTTQIMATVNNVTREGILKLELYNRDKGFLTGDQRLRSVRVPAMDGTQTICIRLPEAGRYAIAAYHDRDGNRKLRKKWNFTPREPYALSNNPAIKELRKPDFEEAAFDVPVTGTSVTLDLVDLKAEKRKDRD